jgi:hypothetical protein
LTDLLNFVDDLQIGLKKANPSVPSPRISSNVRHHQPQPHPHAMTFIDGNSGNTPRFDG